MALRVVQWTTGNVGERSVRAVAQHPDLELVGCFAWSPEKVGRDVGELVGIDPVGVTATDDVDALLALQPDCVVYNPMWPDVDELVRILEGGVNVVSTAALIDGTSLGADRQRLVDACERGGSSLFGTGVNPGFAQLLAMVTAGICDRVDKITITEAADSTLYDSPATEVPCGFGRPIDDPELPAMTAAGTAVFSEAVNLLADALGVQLDSVTCEAEYAQTTERLEMESWTIEAGCVAGIDVRWLGKLGDRTLIEIRMRWKKGQTLEPDWEIEDGYHVVVDGRPTVRTRVQLLPPPDFEAETFADFMVLGMIITGMPAINAIPRVVAAPPGIVTYTDLPLPLPRGVVST
jgi:hypothetical protein